MQLGSSGTYLSQVDDDWMTALCYIALRGKVTMGDIVRVVRQGRFIGWYIRYKDVDGKRKMRASHQPSQQLARRYLLEVEGRVARGVIGIPELAPQAPTVARLVERFLCEYSRPKLKDLERYRILARTALRRVLPVIGERAADSLTTGDIARLRQILAKRYADNSVRLALTCTATVFSWARKESILSNNPFQGVELPPRRDLVEYLSREEIQALLTVCAKDANTGNVSAQMLYGCVHLAIHSGLRKGELLGLRWQDLDLETRRLTVSRSFRSTPKGGKIRHLRLPLVCVPILSSWRKLCPTTPEGLVFPVLNQGKARMGESRSMLGLPTALEQAGCHPLQRAWHALRHTFASHFVMSGGNILALQKILGHHDIKQTMTYAHLATEYLGDEMDRIKF